MEPYSIVKNFWRKSCTASRTTWLASSRGLLQNIIVRIQKLCYKIVVGPFWLSLIDSICIHQVMKCPQLFGRPVWYNCNAVILYYGDTSLEMFSGSQLCLSFRSIARLQFAYDGKNLCESGEVKGKQDSHSKAKPAASHELECLPLPSAAREYGLVRCAQTRKLSSAHVPSHFNRALLFSPFRCMVGHLQSA
jgi:hypothetical protein